MAPVNTTGFTAPAVELPPVRTTASPAHRARTELGRRLWELREQMAGAGVPMLDLDELTRETRERRGEER